MNNSTAGDFSSSFIFPTTSPNSTSTDMWPGSGGAWWVLVAIYYFLCIAAAIAACVRAHRRLRRNRCIDGDEHIALLALEGGDSNMGPDESDVDGDAVGGPEGPPDDPGEDPSSVLEESLVSGIGSGEDRGK